jgi:hypothetical protein
MGCQSSHARSRFDPQNGQHSPLLLAGIAALPGIATLSQSTQKYRSMIPLPQLN